jgi:hypothetical protein
MRVSTFLAILKAGTSVVKSQQIRALPDVLEQTCVAKRRSLVFFDLNSTATGIYSAFRNTLLWDWGCEFSKRINVKRPEQAKCSWNSGAKRGRRKVGKANPENNADRPVCPLNTKKNENSKPRIPQISRIFLTG